MKMCQKSDFEKTWRKDILPVAMKIHCPGQDDGGFRGTSAGVGVNNDESSETDKAW